MINVNEYFGGAVKSLGYTSVEGKSTVGVIEAGEYEFGTSSPEIMHIIEGELSVQLSGDTQWKIYGKGQSFDVPSNSSFKAKAKEQTSYLCKYK